MNNIDTILKPQYVIFELTLDEYETMVNAALKRDTGINCRAGIGIDGDTGFVSVEVNIDNMTGKECETCGKAGYNLQEPYELSNMVLASVFKTDELLAPYVDPEYDTNNGVGIEDLIQIEMTFDTYMKYANK